MVKKLINTIKEFSLAILISLILVNTFGLTFIHGQSMMPTISDRDFIFIDKASYKFHKPKHNDIVVLKSKLKYTLGRKKLLIKRIIGIEGDTITIKNGKVYLNNQELKESFINGDFTFGDVKVTILKDKVFVMGDNRPNSLDSRSLEVGLVDISDIIGKAYFRLFPLSEIEKLN